MRLEAARGCCAGTRSGLRLARGCSAFLRRGCFGWPAGGRGRWRRRWHCRRAAEYQHDVHRTTLGFLASPWAHRKNASQAQQRSSWKRLQRSCKRLHLQIVTVIAFIRYFLLQVQLEFSRRCPVASFCGAIFHFATSRSGFSPARSMIGQCRIPGVCRYCDPFRILRGKYGHRTLASHGLPPCALAYVGTACIQRA